MEGGNCYKQNGGLHMVNFDHDAMLMTELVPGYGEIEVYVEHIVEEPVINSDLEDVDDDYNDEVDDDDHVNDVDHVDEDEVVDVDVDEDEDDLYDRYTNMSDDEVLDQNANNRDANNSDNDSWDNVEDVEQPEVIGIRVLYSDY